MKIKRSIIATLAALTLVSCSSPRGGQVISESSSSAASSSSIATYTVSFYDGATLLNSIEVEEGRAVNKPADPTKEEYSFKEWCTDVDLTTAYDFSLPVNSNLSLYASFIPLDYFEGYNKDYLPAYSPLQTEELFFNGQKDVEFDFSTDVISLKDDISPNMVYLHGDFSHLKVKSVTSNSGRLSIKTEGKLYEGNGYIALARETNEEGIYVTSTIPVADRRAEIDTSSFRLDEERKLLDFTINMKNIKLVNEDNLSKEDYMKKVNAGEIKYFSVSPSDKYSLEMISISDDFTAFRFRLHLPEALSEALAKDLLDNVKIHVEKEALTSNEAQDFSINLFEPALEISVKLLKYSEVNYKGVFNVKLHDCLVTNTFKDNLDKFLVYPKNVDFIVTMPDYTVSLTSLSVPDVTTITGEFIIAAEDLSELGIAYVDLTEFELEDGSKACFVKNWYKDQDIIPIKQVVEYELDKSVDPGGGTGTVTQSANQSYRSVKSEIEVNTFDPQMNDDVNDAETLVNAATNIGMIGYGLYSGDFATLRAGASKLLGIEAIADPTTKILSALASIYDKLLEIEQKIDSIIDQLDVIQAELEQLGQQSLLSNYLAAHTAWKAFTTDFYMPLKDAIVSYSNDYFRYFYNIVVDSYDPYAGKEPTVTLNYDRAGNLVFPSRNPALSIDGKPIDKSKTVTIVIPQLNHSLIGLFGNNGHVYPEIEEDVIVDLFSYGNLDEATIRDIIKTLRFQAMQTHFSDAEKLDGFSATFTNFVQAFTSTEFGTTINAGITPLDCYRIMLETVYNFGFELEPQFNLIVSKIESTYYCARSILNLVQFINAGEIVSSRYTELDKTVAKEFTDTRFYHNNIDDKTIYCYSTGGYLTYDIQAYGIAVRVTGDYDHGWKEKAFINRGETYDRYNHDEPAELVSIDEASVRLMALKVKLYNNLKGTAYNFGEYLCQIGLIPQDKMEFTLGVIISMGGFTDDDDTIDDMKFPAGWSIDTDRHYTYAFKGKAYSFADFDTVNGLCAITYNAVGTPLGNYAGIGDVTNVGCLDYEDWYNYGVFAYYLNFIPVAVN
ncbi:MAG: InlB B-repeat-containing protein [Bacilli bacterium]|nr:InlB B-repeat-containing protein [Bacilli bacterium]